MTDKTIDDFLMSLDEEAEAQTAEAPQVDPAEVEQLREFKAQTEAAQREAAISAAFEEAGLPVKAAKLFAALNPDGEVTKDAVKSFATEYGLSASRPSGFTPTALGSEGRVPAARKYTRAEMEEIARVNPERARALYDAGKVVWNNPEVGKR